MEKWRKIKGWKHYEVSNLGRIRKGRTLFKGTVSRRGYTRVSLSLNGITTKRMLHRLVAKAFIPNPMRLPEVNHIKGRQKWNNAVSNLEWRSGHGNYQHAVQTSLTHGCGVYFIKARKKWRAGYSPRPNKWKHLGYFPTKHQALAVRKSAVARMAYTR